MLFAINEEYCINEKKAVRIIEGFDRKPVDYKVRIDQVITLLSTNIDHTRQSVEILEDLIEGTKLLLNK